MIQILKFKSVAAGAILIGALTSCYVEVSEEKDDEFISEESQTPTYYLYDIPDGARGRAQLCEERRDFRNGERHWLCFRNDDYTWRTSCKSSDCRAVNVFTHYMLTEEIGTSETVHVEAFDNAHFQGYPVAKVEVNGFRARRGEFGEAELFLSPGEYFLRAYMTTGGEPIVPYQFGGMELVADDPVGVFGALSSVKSIRIKPTSEQRYPDPVHIYLDKLFEKPGAAPDTKAHLRLALQVEQADVIPDGRDVVIRLHRGRDLEELPLQEFTFPSENLLVTGRVGNAEFVTPSLPVGEYVVFAFIDANDNGFHDEGELARVYQEDGQIKAVRIDENRTVSLRLALAIPAADAQGTGEDVASDEGRSEG